MGELPPARIGRLDSRPRVLPDSANVVAPLIAECFRSNGLPLPAAQVIANSLRVRETMTSRGHFLTILPSSSLYPRDLRASLKILPVALPVKPQLVEIITLKGRLLSPVAKLFLIGQRLGEASDPRANTIRAKSGVGMNLGRGNLVSL